MSRSEEAPHDNLRATEEKLRQATARLADLERELEDVQEQHRLATDRLRSDLALAREIQKSLLPEPAPAWDGLELRCYSKPALEIGGDFYTYKASSKARVLLSKYVIAVGDVSGKGVSGRHRRRAQLGYRGHAPSLEGRARRIRR